MEPKANGHEPLLTPQEDGAWLKMKPERILEAFRAGKLRGLKYGKLVRFTRQDVDAFIQNHLTIRNR